MENIANDPSRKTWINVPENSDFPIQNIPFGVFITTDDEITTGTRIGDTAIDLNDLQQLGYFEDIDLPDGLFLQDTLNDFISLGRSVWRQVRGRLAEIFDETNPKLRDNEAHKREVLYPINEVQMLMPVFAQDYTDFYSSKEHATNLGTMFRDKDNPLLENWLHIPVGYHGRSSSIVISGENIHRPKGQTKAPGADGPSFGPSKRMDFELEMAFITSDGKPLGDRISVAEAEDYIFGMVIFNDWSARDIQKWDYVPLGPFLGKIFGSSISPWVVTLDALEPFRVYGPEQDPKPLDYLQSNGPRSYNINLEVYIQPKDSVESKISTSNYRYMYWNMCQQLAHHTVNGCNINSGDMMASGTISGPTHDSCGSMLELSRGGTEKLKLDDGQERAFIEDYDTVVMKAFSTNDNVRIGFGEVRSQLLPAK
jgi:fumarylacetoacetase